jgi:hypothetical protein
MAESTAERKTYDTQDSICPPLVHALGFIRSVPDPGVFDAEALSQYARLDPGLLGRDQAWLRIERLGVCLYLSRPA